MDAAAVSSGGSTLGGGEKLPLHVSCPDRYLEMQPDSPCVSDSPRYIAKLLLWRPGYCWFSMVAWPSEVSHWSLPGGAL